MLVLSRKQDEVLIIGEAPNLIKIVVVEIRANNSVRLGIEADKSVPVHREEVYNDIHKGDQNGKRK